MDKNSKLNVTITPTGLLDGVKMAISQEEIQTIDDKKRNSQQDTDKKRNSQPDTDKKRNSKTDVEKKRNSKTDVEKKRNSHTDVTDKDEVKKRHSRTLSKLIKDESLLVQPYNEAIKYARPFDLVAFKGSDLISFGIMSLQEIKLGFGAFSHCGLIVTSECLPYISQLEKGKIYVLESTFSGSTKIKGVSDGVPNIVTGKGKFGCQIRDFEKVIASYTENPKSAVAICTLIKNPWDVVADREALIEKLKFGYEKYGSRTYNANPLSLLGAIFPQARVVTTAIDTTKLIGNMMKQLFCCGGRCLGCCEVSDTPTNLFCSQLVAELYQSVGILNTSIDASYFAPVDFMGYDEDGTPNLVSTPIYVIPNK